MFNFVNKSMVELDVAVIYPNYWPIRSKYHFKTRIINNLNEYATQIYQRYLSKKKDTRTADMESDQQMTEVNKREQLNEKRQIVGMLKVYPSEINIDVQ